MPDPSTDLAALSWRALVVVRPGQLVLVPAHDVEATAGEPPVAVFAPHTALLERLADHRPHHLGTLCDEVVGELGCEPGVLSGFLAELEQLDLLLAATEPTEPGSGDPPAPARLVGDGDPPPTAAEALVFPTPRALPVVPGGFALHAPDGTVDAVLTARELQIVRTFAKGATPGQAWMAHRVAFGDSALDRARFDEVVLALRSLGALRPADDEVVQGDASLHARVAQVAGERLQAGIDRQLAALAVDVAEREQRLGRQLIRVLPVSFMDDHVPLALGLIYAYAQAYEDGRLLDWYELRPDWLVGVDDLPALVDRPTVGLFSNYVWNHGRCLEASARLKDLDPRAVTIHGGPDTPRYPADVEAYFERNPHVDVAVHGEGEQTAAEVLAALAPSVAAGTPDLSVLAEVPGLTYRDGDRIVRTADRDRIADLDTIPSPYLTGVFDAFVDVPGTTGLFESNRGCPYGCTFCDWGSATLSRIRKFDLQRVLDELTWMAERRFFSFGNADANFGIYSRDVDIARHIVELKASHGYPITFGANYAKNTVKHLRPIIEMMSEGGILSFGVLSLQTMDADTLDVVARQNIRLDRYDELAVTMQEAGLPLFVDLMLGLPGQTLDAFRADLQACADREVQTRIARTELLVNSPMNDPGYRARHGIELSATPVKVRGDDSHAFVVAAASFTAQDRRQMMRLRQLFLLAENFGVLRHVGRYVRAETGIGELRFLEELDHRVNGDPERWPVLWQLLELVPQMMVAPGSWPTAMAELRRYLVTEVGIADDDALTTVLDVQSALLPDARRRFPATIELPHDYVAWWRQVTAAKAGADRASWPDAVAPLRSLPPGRFEVDDPGGAATRALGGVFWSYGFGLNWELDSPMARPFLVGEEGADHLRRLPELLGL